MAVILLRLLLQNNSENGWYHEYNLSSHSGMEGFLFLFKGQNGLDPHLESEREAKG